MLFSVEGQRSGGRVFSGQSWGSEWTEWKKREGNWTQEQERSVFLLFFNPSPVHILKYKPYILTNMECHRLGLRSPEPDANVTSQNKKHSAEAVPCTDEGEHFFLLEF